MAGVTTSDPGIAGTLVLSTDFDVALEVLIRDSEIPQTGGCATSDQTAFALVWVLLYCKELALHVLDRIRSIAAGPYSLEQKMQFAEGEYLSYFPVVLVAAVRVMALKGIGGKNGAQPTLSDVFAVAGKINVWKPTPEPVIVFWTKKSKGGFRQICDFGPQRRIMQTLVGDLLLASGVDNEFDFTRRGAGGEIALRDEVINALGDGYNWWWTTDVVDCFSSLKPGHFKWLHMNRLIMRNVAYIPKCAKVLVVQKGPSAELLEYLCSAYPDLMDVYGSLTPKERIRQLSIDIVRRGLPQGSCLSNVLARAFIGRELCKLLESFDARPVCWIDDLAIGFRTNESAKAAEGFLLKVFLQQPAGQVQLHKLKVQSIEDKRVNILGYAFEPGHGFDGAPVHVRPGRKRIDRFRKRLVRAWTSYSPKWDLWTSAVRAELVIATQSSGSAATALGPRYQSIASTDA